MSVFWEKILIITGGTGPFGHTVLKYFLASDIGEIHIFSRAEKKQDNMRHKLQDDCHKYFSKVKFYLSGVFFKDLSLVGPEVDMKAVGKDLGETIGNIIAKSYELVVEIKPDALLILGDTNSCRSAIAANRRIVDHISGVNMYYSEHARRYLNAEGTAKECTYVTGSPMAEVLHANLAQIEASDVHARLGLEKIKHMLLSAHRGENLHTEQNFLSLFNAINKMAEKYDMPILYSGHPRSRKRID